MPLTQSILGTSYKSVRVQSKKGSAKRSVTVEKLYLQLCKCLESRSWMTHQPHCDGPAGLLLLHIPQSIMCVSVASFSLS